MKLVAALAVAVATRVAVFASAVSDPTRFVTKDSQQYDALARHFGAAYVHAHPLALSLLRPPGYPAFLAGVYDVFGHSVTAAIVVEIVIGVGTVYGVYLLADRLLGETAAFVAALALALDPVSVAMTSNLTTETLFAALWVAAALCWVRLTPPWLAAAGFLVGVSVLVRPIAEYLPVLLVPLTFFLTRRIALAALLLVAFAVPVGLWVVRNHHETGVATVSTIGAHNLLDYRAADALAIDDGGSRATAAQRLDAQVPHRSNPARTAQAESSLAWQTLVHHPKGAVLTTVEGFGRVLFGPGRAELGRLTTRSRLLVAIEVFLLGCLLVLAAAGIVLLARCRAWLALAATVTFALSDIALSAGAEGNARLRMPASPFLAVLAGAAVSSLVARSAARPSSRSHSPTERAASTK
jgi:4-amino-4-deoxy-L-arabinose transferase-like glycosyltransferase